MKVGIIVLRDCTPLTPIACMEILNKGGYFYNYLNKIENEQSFFDVNLISLSEKMVNTSLAYPLYCHKNIDEVNNLDLIIVPGLDLNINQQLKTNYDWVQWLKMQHNNGVEIASICTGAFLLAEAGLLDYKNATTHWNAADYFIEKYPKVNLLLHNIIVDEGNIYTSGGVTSYQNLMIYLIEKFCGRDTALYTSRMMLIDQHKESQMSYAIFSHQKNHNDEDIKHIQSFIEENYNKKLIIDNLAEKASMSKRNFIRRFKKATGNTPLEYIQRVRIEAVKKSLEKGNKGIENIIRDVGYGDIPTFRGIFKRYTGISPLQYKRKYAQVQYSKA